MDCQAPRRAVAVGSGNCAVAACAPVEFNLSLTRRRQPSPWRRNSATIEGLKNEQRYRDAFTAAMDAARIDTVILPTFRHLPVINGDRRTSTSLTMIASALQWPAISIPRGFLGEGLPQGLQIIGRAWEEPKIIGYAFAYEQSTHHRRPPSLPPMNL